MLDLLIPWMMKEKLLSLLKISFPLISIIKYNKNKPYSKDNSISSNKLELSNNSANLIIKSTEKYLESLYFIKFKIIKS